MNRRGFLSFLPLMPIAAVAAARAKPKPDGKRCYCVPEGTELVDMGFTFVKLEDPPPQPVLGVPDGYVFAPAQKEEENRRLVVCPKCNQTQMPVEPECSS